MKERLKAFVDLTRAHFCFAWPLLFCSGLVLAFENYGGFSWWLVIRAGLMGLFGFEAGFILNDYVDRVTDQQDVEHDKLTRYWRPFRKRPIPSGRVSPQAALALFVVFVIFTLCLILTLPFPNNVYLLVLTVLSYSLEFFYQVKKRNQRFPFAQLLGRIDFALFPVSGYLCYGRPDLTALLYVISFYPWVIAHLGVNDLVDVKNDQSRGMKTIPILYGVQGTVTWILLFSLAHVVLCVPFLIQRGPIVWAGFGIGFILVGIANFKIVKDRNPEAGLFALPLFHVSMILYAASLILGYAL